MTTSNSSLGTGSDRTSPTSKRTRGSTISLAAEARKSVDGSTPRISRGLATSRIAWVKAPVPQPTSSHARPGDWPSQVRRTPATGRLQRPMYASYASVFSQMFAPVASVISYFPILQLGAGYGPAQSLSFISVVKIVACALLVNGVYRCADDGTCQVGLTSIFAYGRIY